MRSLIQLIATMILVFLTFLPYFALRSLGEVAGHRVLFELFFLKRQKLEIVAR